MPAPAALSKPSSSRPLTASGPHVTEIHPAETRLLRWTVRADRAGEIEIGFAGRGSWTWALAVPVHDSDDMAVLVAGPDSGDLEATQLALGSHHTAVRLTAGLERFIVVTDNVNVEG